MSLIGRTRSDAGRIKRASDARPTSGSVRRVPDRRTAPFPIAASEAASTAEIYQRDLRERKAARNAKAFAGPHTCFRLLPVGVLSSNTGHCRFHLSAGMSADFDVYYFTSWARGDLIDCKPPRGYNAHSRRHSSTAILPAQCILISITNRLARSC